MLINFCGIIHSEYIPEGTTVNHTAYVKMWLRFIDAVRDKLEDLWRDH
jgi:hypothetical protein